MKISKQSIGFLCVVTLPQLLLSVLFALLLLQKPNEVAGWVLAASLVANVFFTVYVFIKGKTQSLSMRFHMLLACTYAAMLIGGMVLLEDSSLWGVMSVRLTALLIDSAAVIYALFQIANRTSADISKQIVALVAVPLIWLFAYNILSGARLDTAVMILIVLGGIVMAYLIIKIILVKRQEKIESGQRPKRLALYIIFSLVLPIAGLTLNVSMDNLFGDFSDPLFFFVPFINGVLLIVPPPSEKRLRLLRFFIIAAATTYLLYFFIAFLPYMPIGFLGLAIVLGALVFAPAAALVMQIIYLIQEWKAVSVLWGTIRLTAVFVAGLVLLPILVLTSYLGDRVNLEKAIAYTEQDISVNGEIIDFGRLDRALDNADAVEEKDRFFDMRVADNTPILSSIYAHLVLDSRILANDRLEKLRMAFFGEYPEQGFANGLTTDMEMPQVKLKDISTQTTFDNTTGIFRTWVNITLQGPKNGWNEEYVTEFALPEGAYISDYYLDVFGTKKMGILADQRAAMWLYNDIVVQTPAQDPGLLHYTGDRTIELRVYPFNGDEPRYTGFEIIHNETATIRIDGEEVLLSAPPQTRLKEMEHAVLIPGAVKDGLPVAQERPRRYYFIVDCSKDSDIDDQLYRIEDYAQGKGILDATVIFATYKTNTCRLKNADSVNITPQSGFNLALAVKSILIQNGDDSVPVILFTSDNPALALIPKNVTVLAAQYPESDYYYRLNADETLNGYDFETGKNVGKMNQPLISQARMYNGVRVRDDSQTQILPNDSVDFMDMEISGNEYEQAVMLDIAARNGGAQNAAQSLKLLRASFKAGILTPQTAFIVVETQAQEVDLLAKQQQLIKEDKELIKEQNAVKSLDEPSALVCAFIALLGLSLVKLWKRNRTETR